MSRKIKAPTPERKLAQLNLSVPPEFKACLNAVSLVIGQRYGAYIKGLVRRDLYLYIHEAIACGAITTEEHQKVVEKYGEPTDRNLWAVMCELLCLLRLKHPSYHVQRTQAQFARDFQEQTPWADRKFFEERCRETGIEPPPAGIADQVITKGDMVVSFDSRQALDEGAAEPDTP